MNIAVLGAGSIGSFLGGCLATGGKLCVALIGREPHVNAVREAGLTLEFPTHSVVAYLEAFTQIWQVRERPDLVVLTVRAYQTHEALAQLVEVFGTDVPVITFQNGCVLETIAQVVGARNTIGGTTLINARLVAPGRVRQAINCPVVIGELRGTNSRRIQAIRDAFTAGGLETYVSNNVIGEIWAKMIINSTSNTLTGATNMTIRQVFASNSLRRFAYEMVKESFLVAGLEHIDLDNVSPGLAGTYQQSISSLETWDCFAEGPQPDIKLSMCTLLERGIKTEVDYTNGYIATKAAQHGVPAPHHEAAVRAIHEIEEGVRQQSPDVLIGQEAS